jgi:hypothetical protein
VSRHQSALIGSKAPLRSWSGGLFPPPSALMNSHQLTRHRCHCCRRRCCHCCHRHRLLLLRRRLLFGAIGCILALVVVLRNHRRLPLLGDRLTSDGVLEAISSLYGVTSIHSQEVHNGSMIKRRQCPFERGIDIRTTIHIL